MLVRLRELERQQNQQLTHKKYDGLNVYFEEENEEETIELSSYNWELIPSSRQKCG